jgi:hypothetical protein
VTPSAEGGVDGLQGSLLQVDVAEIIVHKGDEPNAVFDFVNADGLAGEHDGEIDLLAEQADAPTSGDVDLPVVEGVGEVR